MTDTLLDAVHVVMAILDGAAMTEREEEIYSLLMVAVRKQTEASDTTECDDINAADPLIGEVRNYLDAHLNETISPMIIARHFRMGYGRAAKLMKEIGE